MAVEKENRGDSGSEASRDATADPEVEARLHSPQFLQLRAEGILEYPTDVYPFRRHVVSAMGLPHDYGDRLHCLHESLPGFDVQRSCKKEKEVLHKRVKEAVLGKGELYKLYVAFILEWVAPRMDMGSGRLVFQAFPCLRLQPPSTHCIGKPHTDSSYHHQAGQINFWLPLTTVGGANSLHIESEPGKKDFHPLEMTYGQVAKFYGNKCHHYTVPNSTPHTRVSLDFRVVPGPVYEEDAAVSRSPFTGRQMFAMGSYYSECRRPSPGAPFQLVECDGAIEPGAKAGATQRKQSAVFR